MLDCDLALAYCSRIRRDRGIPGATADHRLHPMPPIPVVRNEHKVRRPRANTVRKLSISVLKTKPLCLRGQSANSWIDHENSKKLHRLCYFLGPLCCIYVCVKFFNQFPLYSCNFILRIVYEQITNNQTVRTKVILTIIRRKMFVNYFRTIYLWNFLMNENYRSN